jgi:hypothetical protein
MGFFDNLLKTGLKAAERAVNRAVNDAVYDNVHETVDRSVRDGIDKAKDALGIPNTPTRTSAPVQTSSPVKTTTSSAPAKTSTSIKYEDDGREFFQKLPEVMAKIGDFEIRKNISPAELESKAGRELYKRGGCYREPEDIAYGIYKDGECVLYINTWWDYTTYKRVANRALKNYCDQSDVPMLEFFERLPNSVEYMEERIRKALGC